MKICVALATVCLMAATVWAADYEAEARAVLANILAKDYVAAAKNFDAKMMTALPPATLKQVFETQIQPQIGSFQAVREVKTATQGGFTVITLVSNFERGVVNVIVAFDPQGKVGGLFFKPAQPPTEAAATRFSDYQTKTKN